MELALQAASQSTFALSTMEDAVQFLFVKIGPGRLCV